MMKKKISMALAGLGLCASLMMFNTQEASATMMIDAGDKGTLYGNEAGTSFCCKSGTNSCSAKAC